MSRSKVKTLLYRVRQGLKRILEKERIYAMNRESLSNAVGLIDDDILDEYDKRQIEREHAVKYQTRWKRWAATAACAAILLSAATGIAWAASGEFRGVLAEFLHLDDGQTHAVGVSATDGGIQITVVSTHSNEDVSVILLSIEKTNGESFSYSWNPGDTSFSDAGKELAWTGSVLTRCSEDRKTLFLLYHRPV